MVLLLVSCVFVGWVDAWSQLKLVLVCPGVSLVCCGGVAVYSWAFVYFFVCPRPGVWGRAPPPKVRQK